MTQLHQSENRLLLSNCTGGLEGGNPSPNNWQHIANNVSQSVLMGSTCLQCISLQYSGYITVRCMLQWSGSYIALFFSEHFTYFASFTHFNSFIQAVFFYLTHTIQWRASWGQYLSQDFWHADWRDRSNFCLVGEQLYHLSYSHLFLRASGWNECGDSQ